MIPAVDSFTVVTVVVAAFTALTGVLTWFVNGVRTERTRLQKLYADAYSAVISYQEYPYVIRRRRPPSSDHPGLAGEERLRISEALHVVHEALNNHLARISTESDAVSAKYLHLVQTTRDVVGVYMHEAWEADPLDNDPGMNLRFDYSALSGAQQQYLDAVKRDMTFWRVAHPRQRKHPRRLR